MQYMDRWGSWLVGLFLVALSGTAESQHLTAGGDTGLTHRQRPEAILLASSEMYRRQQAPVINRQEQVPKDAQADHETPPARPRHTSDAQPAPPKLSAEQLGTDGKARPVLLLRALQTHGDNWLDADASPASPSRDALDPANVGNQYAYGVGPRRDQLSAGEQAQTAGAHGRASAEDDGPMDLFIFETFAGPTFMAMALGRNDQAIANLQALTNSDLSLEAFNELDPSSISAGDFVHTVSGSGTMVGGAASVRLGYLSVGGRMSYSAYDALNVMTVTGEMAFRAYTDPMEFYLGMGLGGGFLYDVSPGLAKQQDGLAMRMGLGVSFRITDNIGLGAGVDAVGLFMAGDGISPLQLAKIGQDTDHPIGAQLPLHVDLSVVL